MNKVPESAKKEIPRKCPLCGIKFKSKEYLVSHIDKEHSDQIPQDWSASRYENYLRTNKDHGNCVVCGTKTEWNESTWKYNRLCKNKACSDKLSSNADKNMIGKYGKVHLLNDADQQRKMIYSKKTSGVYYWSDDDSKKFKKYYASSVELKFLEMLDVFLNLDVEDVFSPSPNNYTYKYEGKDHVYIPDVYIASLNLEVELKEPKDNQNMHPKIQAVDKVKEDIKDETMKSIEFVNYIKVNGTDYRDFFTMFSYLKNRDTLYERKSKVSKVFESEFIDPDTIEDIDIEEELNEILQEPVVEGSNARNLSSIVNKIKHEIKLVKDPYCDKSLNFDRQIKLYKDYVKDCDNILKDNPSTYYELSKSLKRYKEYLKNISDKGDKHELSYEATKAIPEIDKLIQILDNKFDRVKKYHSVIKSPVHESVISGDKNDVKYKPVFIVLTSGSSLLADTIKKITNSEFSHATIALDTDMTQLFSFDRRGFVHDGLMDLSSRGATKYAVYMYMATEAEFNKISNTIALFNDNESEYKYSTKGLINYLLGKETKYSDEFFCSEFVSYLLNDANPNLLKRHYSLYSPADLANMKKTIKIDEGPISKFSMAKIDTLIRKNLARRGFDNVTCEQK